MIKIEKHDRYFIELEVRDRVEFIKGDGTCDACIYDKGENNEVICEGLVHICQSGTEGHFIKDTDDKDCRLPLKVTSICGLY